MSWLGHQRRYVNISVAGKRSRDPVDVIAGGQSANDSADVITEVHWLDLLRACLDPALASLALAFAPTTPLPLALDPERRM